MSFASGTPIKEKSTKLEEITWYVPVVDRTVVHLKILNATNVIGARMNETLRDDVTERR